MFKIHCLIFISCCILNILTVPSSVCRADFRWDDCGKPPKAVMYYWKQGSRCEIGMWKGCLPNPNMFADEYECINTCVFVERPSMRTETEGPETEATSDYTNFTQSITNATDAGTSVDGANASTETLAPSSTDNTDKKDGEGNKTGGSGNETGGNRTV